MRGNFCGKATVSMSVIQAALEPPSSLEAVSPIMIGLEPIWMSFV